MTKNPIRDAILQKIAQNPSISIHSAEKNASGTKYLSAFISGDFTFVIDKMAAKKQPIWVLNTKPICDYLDVECIQYDVYPSSKGRNSNLHKLPNFKTEELLRIYPTTVEQAMKLLAKFG